MNPNDLLAQQQALMDQSLNQQHHVYWGMIVFMIVFQVVGLAVSGWVLYLFYARLRDIAIELKRLRIAYESSPSPQALQRPVPSPEPLTPSGDHSRYKPK